VIDNIGRSLYNIRWTALSTICRWRPYRWKELKPWK